MAIIARWRMPPLKRKGYSSTDPFCFWHAHFLQHFDRLLASGALRNLLCSKMVSVIWSPIGMQHAQ
jgi:hypothetical protein